MNTTVKTLLKAAAILLSVLCLASSGKAGHHSSHSSHASHGGHASHSARSSHGNHNSGPGGKTGHVGTHPRQPSQPGTLPRQPGTGQTSAARTAHPGTSSSGQGHGSTNHACPRVVNHTIWVRVTLINYVTSARGLTVRGVNRVILIDNCTLDSGDVIVSVGNVLCSSTTLSLEELIELAYRNNILVMVVRHGNSGTLVRHDLPPRQY